MSVFPAMISRLATLRGTARIVPARTPIKMAPLTL
jgi:hypothetical protein